MAVGRTFFEVGEEERRLVILHLTMLDGLPAERVVQLHGLDGRRAPLVLPRSGQQQMIHTDNKINT